MKRLLIFLACLTFAGASPAWAQPAAAPADFSGEARATLERATKFLQSISAGGGYLWIYSPDLRRRAGESVADANHIWIQPPGTPTVGQAFLRAYSVTRDERFLNAARSVAEALGRCQLGSGGWHYSADMAHLENNRDGLLDYKGRAFARANPGKPINPLYTIATTFDDDNTQSAVRFLIACATATRGSDSPRDLAIRATLTRALDGMLRAQYRNGAWPEQYDGKPYDPAAHAPKAARVPADYPRVWPHAPDYTAGYTLNDDTQRDCILTLLEAWEKFGDARHLEAAKRGGDFLVRAQLPEPHPIWAQQYNFAMEPAWARAWEPPSATSGESGGVLQALIALHLATGETRYLEPLPAALAFFDRAAIAPGKWARMYELETNRPIYGDMNGRIYHSLGEISEERRNGYRWEGSFHLPEILGDCRDLLKLGRDKFRAEREKKAPPESSERRSLAAKARRIIDQLDGEGRWIANGRFRKRDAEEPVISTEVFAQNVETLCAYLESQTGMRRK